MVKCKFHCKWLWVSSLRRVPCYLWVWSKFLRTPPCWVEAWIKQHILHRTCALTTKSQASVFSGNWHYGYAEWPVFRGMKTLLGKCFLFGFVWWLHFEVSVLQKTCFTSMPFLWVDDCIRGIDLNSLTCFRLSVSHQLKSVSSGSKVLDLKVSWHGLVAIHKVQHL